MNIQLNRVTCPTCPEKFIRDNVGAPSVRISIVIVTLPHLCLMSGSRVDNVTHEWIVGDSRNPRIWIFHETEYHNVKSLSSKYIPTWRYYNVLFHGRDITGGFLYGIEFPIWRYFYTTKISSYDVKEGALSDGNLLHDVTRNRRNPLTRWESPSAVWRQWKCFPMVRNSPFEVTSIRRKFPHMTSRQVLSVMGNPPHDVTQNKYSHNDMTPQVFHVLGIPSVVWRH